MDPIWGAYPPDKIWNADHIPAPFSVNVERSLNMKVFACVFESLFKCVCVFIVCYFLLFCFGGEAWSLSVCRESPAGLQWLALLVWKREWQPSIQRSALLANKSCHVSSFSKVAANYFLIHSHTIHSSTHTFFNRLFINSLTQARTIQYAFRQREHLKG